MAPCHPRCAPYSVKALWGEIKFHLRLGLACYFSDTFSSSAIGPLWAVAPSGVRYLHEVSSPRSFVRGPTCSLLNLQTIERKTNIYLYNEWTSVTASESVFIKGILKAYSQNEEKEKSRGLTTTKKIRNPGGNLGGQLMGTNSNWQAAKGATHPLLDSGDVYAHPTTGGGHELGGLIHGDGKEGPRRQGWPSCSVT